MLALLVLVLLISGAFFLIFGERELGSRLATGAIVLGVVTPLLTELGTLLMTALVAYWWLILLALLVLGVGVAALRRPSPPALPEGSSLKHRVDHDG